MARTCNIDAGGGPVTVTLLIDNALISGGKFAVYDFDTGQINENFEVRTDDTGSGSYQINIPSSNLTGQVLSWSLLTCSSVGADTGVLNIQVFQDGNPCPTNPPATYTLNSVPNCALSMALPVKGGLHFR